MYRELIKWIIVGFASVPPYAIAEEAAGALATAESASGTFEAIGNTGLFMRPEGIAILGLTATSLLVTATSVYFYETHEAKRIYREAREQARAALASRDPAPVTHAGPESSLARAVEIEKAAVRRERGSVPTLSERDWAIAVVTHATEVESL